MRATVISLFDDRPPVLFHVAQVMTVEWLETARYREKQGYQTLLNPDDGFDYPPKFRNVLVDGKPHEHPYMWWGFGNHGRASSAWFGLHFDILDGAVQKIRDLIVIAVAGETVPGGPSRSVTGFIRIKFGAPPHERVWLTMIPEIATFYAYSFDFLNGRDALDEPGADAEYDDADVALGFGASTPPPPLSVSG